VSWEKGEKRVAKTAALVTLSIVERVTPMAYGSTRLTMTQEQPFSPKGPDKFIKKGYFVSCEVSSGIKALTNRCKCATIKAVFNI